MGKFLFVHHRHISQLEVQILPTKVSSSAAPAKKMASNLVHGMQSTLQFQIILQFNNNHFANQPFENRVEQLKSKNHSFKKTRKHIICSRQMYHLFVEAAI